MARKLEWLSGHSYFESERGRTMGKHTKIVSTHKSIGRKMSGGKSSGKSGGGKKRY